MSSMDLGQRLRALGDAAAPWPVSILVYYRVTANQLTIAGLVLVGVAAAALYQDHRSLAAALLVLGGVCDALDGQVARATGTDSTVGAFLDSCLDRVADSLPLMILTIITAEQHQPLVWLCAVACLVSSLIPYIKARGESLDCRVELGLMPRAARFILLVVGLLGGPLTLAVCLSAIAVGGTWTVYQRMRGCLAQLQLRSSQ